MTRVDVSKILRKGKCMILAYDQGLEHGPTDFNETNVDPEHIFKIAHEGRYTALAVQIGIAEKYYYGAYRDVPLIIKVNGSTKMNTGIPVSTMLCSVKRAIDAGASAIGFTIYDGSPAEPKMLEEFSKICEEAHDHGLPVVAWMYPRGPGVKAMSNEVLEYVARIGLELGADIIKVKFNGDYDHMSWLVRCAGRTKVVISGGEKTDELGFLNETYKLMQCGVVGRAVGRNVWQSEQPFRLTRALNEVVYQGKTPAEAARHLK